MKILRFIENNDFLKIKVELKKLDNVNLIFEDENENNESLLSFAIKKNNDFETILMMNKFGCSFDYINDEGVGIFDLAVEKNNLELVKYLVEQKNFNPNETKRKSGFTPFMESVCYNYKEMCKYFISKGVDIDKKDNNNMNAFDYAKKMRIKPMLEFLKKN